MEQRVECLPIRNSWFSPCRIREQTSHQDLADSNTSRACDSAGEGLHAKLVESVMTRVRLIRGAEPAFLHCGPPFGEEHRFEFGSGVAEFLLGGRFGRSGLVQRDR